MTLNKLRKKIEGEVLPTNEHRTLSEQALRAVTGGDIDNQGATPSCSVGGADDCQD
jgi:hypothetical protein